MNISLYAVNPVSGGEETELCFEITDGESLKLQYFDFNELPNLESRAKAIIDWLKENRCDLCKK